MEPSSLISFSLHIVPQYANCRSSTESPSKEIWGSSGVFMTLSGTAQAQIPGSSDAARTETVITDPGQSSEPLPPGYHQQQSTSPTSKPAAAKAASGASVVNSSAAQVPPSSQFRCTICQRTYSRTDHLARHFRSRRLALVLSSSTLVIRTKQSPESFHKHRYIRKGSYMLGVLQVILPVVSARFPSKLSCRKGRTSAGCMLLICG